MNIYVSNLKFSMTDSDLKEIFEKFGPVQSCKVITDRNTGRSKGYGFIEMGDDEGVLAIETLNDKDFQGRKLMVNPARERENREPRYNSRVRPGNYQPREDRQSVVNELDYE